MKTDRYTIRDHVICQQINDELILLNATTGQFFGLDLISSATWELMQDESSMVCVKAYLMDAVAVDEKQLEHDLEAFLAQLVQYDLIEVVA